MESSVIMCRGKQRYSNALSHTVGDTKPQEAAPWQKQDDEEPQRDFDESSFLAGRYAILNDEPKPLPARGKIALHLFYPQSTPATDRNEYCM